MLQVARLAPTLLRDAADPVAEFFLSRFNDDGAATDRAGQSDLYYTVFALEGLIALQREFPPRVRLFLERVGDGAHLDLVHLCCLARCWAALRQPGPDLAERIDALWDRDNVYHSFLAWGALQDLGREPEPFPVRDESLATTTPTTAAAVTLLRQMQAAGAGGRRALAPGAGASGRRVLRDQGRADAGPAVHGDGAARAVGPEGVGRAPEGQDARLSRYALDRAGVLRELGG